MDWPPAFDSMIAAPAGEPATSSWVPSTGQLEWTHKALQVTFMGLGLLGLFVILGAVGPKALLRGAAKKHAVA